MKKIIMSTLAIAMMMTMASCSSSDNDVAENITENELQKMTKKEKKFYESPTMTVYEIGRTQILAGSAKTETLGEEEYTW